MSREEELEREWRQNVTSKLLSIEATAKNLEIQLNTLHASNVISRIAFLEEKVTSLDTFRSKVITTVFVSQVAIGIIWTIVAKFVL